MGRWEGKAGGDFSTMYNSVSPSPNFPQTSAVKVPSNSENEDLILFLTGKQAIAAFHQNTLSRPVFPKYSKRNQN